MRPGIRLFALLVLLASSQPLWAAVADGESTYEIEVLIFENRLPDLTGDELLARDSADDHPRGLEQAFPPETSNGESFLTPVVAKQLEQDGHYRVLAHAQWIQTIDAKTIAKPVRITSGNPAAAGELDGLIRFYMSRYLHLDVNLEFRDPASDTATPVIYRMSEQRRIRSQETNYFDHPKFGVLVRVMPVEKNEEEKKL
jgi:hypothetical protein